MLARHAEFAVADFLKARVRNNRGEHRAGRRAADQIDRAVDRLDVDDTACAEAHQLWGGLIDQIEDRRRFVVCAAAKLVGCRGIRLGDEHQLVIVTGDKLLL